MSTAVAMTEAVAAAAAAHLLRPDGDEDLCFALWEPSVGRTRTTAIVKSLIEPRDGDRVLQGNVAFTSAYYERAIAEARAAGAGLALMHSHPPYASGWQDLSKDDYRAEARIAGSVSSATGRPLVGMTIAGGNRYWSARHWSREAPRRYVPAFCETVRIVGDALGVDFHDAQRPPPAFRPRLARTMTAWGADAHRRLARLRVGVVGAGSVGSIIMEALARIGVESVVVIDFDTLEEVNLDRTLNAYDESVEAGISKAALAARAAGRAATALRFEAEPLEMSVCEEEGYRAALDCDVLFSCVDRPWPRSVLNFIAYAHLIPVVDGGIHISRTPSGRMRGAEWKAHIAGPSRRCLCCLAQYDPGLVQAEREGHLDDPTYIESLPDGHPVRANENVFAFSLAAASLELMQFIALVVGPAGVHNYGAQTYHAAVGTIDREASLCEPWCAFTPLVARGDRAGHPGTAFHRVAEAARAERAATT